MRGGMVFERYVFCAGDKSILVPVMINHSEIQTHFTILSMIIISIIVVCVLLLYFSFSFFWYIEHVIIVSSGLRRITIYYM